MFTSATIMIMNFSRQFLRTHSAIMNGNQFVYTRRNLFLEFSSQTQAHSMNGNKAYCCACYRTSKLMINNKKSTLRAETFEGIKVLRFSRFLVIFAKVSAFGNYKPSKRESFFTRNHEYLSNAKVYLANDQQLLHFFHMNMSCTQNSRKLFPRNL